MRLFVKGSGYQVPLEHQAKRLSEVISFKARDKVDK